MKNGIYINNRIDSKAFLNTRKDLIALVRTKGDKNIKLAAIAAYKDIVINTQSAPMSISGCHIQS